MERPPSPRRWLAPALLLLAVACAAVPAWLASRVEPPGNDLGLHGMLVDGAATTLRDHGWTAFQDPWFEHPGGGYPVFHAYPHLPHQLMAAVCVATGADRWTVLGAGCLLMVLLLPLAVFAGGRVLGLSPPQAAFAAVVAATLRCADPYGHGTLNYGFESLGMVGQLWGMVLAAVVFPAWATACAGRDETRPARAVRLLLAAAGVSLVLRTHFPTAWVMALAAGVYVVASGPLAGLPARVARYAAVGVLAAVLSLGFLVGFVRDLDAMVVVDLEHDWKLRSLGALAVLGRLVRGEYLDGLARAPWTPALLTAAGWIVGRWVRERRALADTGLLAAAVVGLVLLFGRHTWGDWVDSLPVVGRFHDHRYLLGLHLLAPWVVAVGLAGLWAALGGTARRVRLPVAVGAVGLAVVVHGMATWIDLRSWREGTAEFQRLEAETEALAGVAVTEPGRLAVAVPDRARGGTTLLAARPRR